MDELQKLYDVLSREGYYSKSFDDFNTQFQDSTYQNKVFDIVSRDGLFTKSKDDFFQKYSPESIQQSQDVTQEQPIQEPVAEQPQEQTESVSYGQFGATGLQRSKDYGSNQETKNELERNPLVTFGKKFVETFEMMGAGFSAKGAGRIQSLASDEQLKLNSIKDVADDEMIRMPNITDPRRGKTEYKASDYRKIMTERISKGNKASEAAINFAIKSQMDLANSDVISSLSQIKDGWDFVNFVSSSMGQAVAQIPLTVATGGATSYAMESGNIYLDVIKEISEKEGITPIEVIQQGKDAKALAEIGGALSGALEMIGAKKVMEVFGVDNIKKDLRKRAMKIFINSQIEGVTEDAQEVVTRGAKGIAVSGTPELPSTMELLDAYAMGMFGSAGIQSTSLLRSGKTKEDQETEQAIEPVVTEDVVDENITPRILTVNEKEFGFIENPDGTIEYTQDGLEEADAMAKKLLLEQKYPNVEFQVVDNTNKDDPYAESDFTIFGRPKDNGKYSQGDKTLSKAQADLKIQSATSIAELEGLNIENNPELEAQFAEKVKELTPVAEEPTAETATEPKISDVSGEVVNVKVRGVNISGQVTVDEGGKVTLEAEDGTIYDLDQDTPFTEYVRPVSITPEGDFEVNGDTYSEARVVTENGVEKALMIKADGTTKAITNPLVVEEIRYRINLAELETMDDSQADALWSTYEKKNETDKQGETEAVAEEGTIETDEDRKLREATEEIDLIEQLALQELEDVDSKAKLVKFTPATLKEEKVYLVKKNEDGTYTATLNGRKVARPEITAQLGQLYESETEAQISDLQKQTDKLKTDVEQKLFGKPKSEPKQQVSEKPTAEKPATPEDVQQEPVDKGNDNEIQVNEPKNEKPAEKTATKVSERQSVPEKVTGDSVKKVGEIARKKKPFFQEIKKNFGFPSNAKVKTVADAYDVAKANPKPSKKDLDFIEAVDKASTTQYIKPATQKGKTPLSKRALPEAHVQALSHSVGKESLYDIASQWLIENRGGLLNQAIWKEVFGSKTYPREEMSKRVRLTSKEGVSVKKMAEKILEDPRFSEMGIDENEMRGAIISVVLENETTDQMAERINKKYDSKNKEQSKSEKNKVLQEDAIAQKYTPEQWANASYSEKADYLNDFYELESGQQVDPETLELLDQEKIKAEVDEIVEAMSFIDAMTEQELQEYADGYEKIEADFAPETTKEEKRFSFSVFGEKNFGVKEGNEYVADDGMRYQESMVEDIKPESQVEAQKSKIKSIVKDLKDQLNDQSSGIIVDFEAKAKAEIKFYKTLKDLVVEYARLKGLQFNEFIADLEGLLDQKINPKDQKYIKTLWQAELSKKTATQRRVEKSVASKPDTGKDLLVNSYQELKKSLREQAKAARGGVKAESERIKGLKSELNDFIKLYSKELNTLGIKLSSTILKRVNDVNSEIGLNNALNYIDQVISNQEFRNQISEKNSLIEKISKEVDTSKQVKREGGVVKSKGSQTADGISVLAKIKQALKMTRLEAETRMGQIQEELYEGRFDENGRPKEDLTPDETFDLEAELYALNFAGLETLSNEQLSSMLKDLQSIKKTDRINALSEKQAFRDKIKENIDQTIKTLNPEGKTVKKQFLAKKSDFRKDSKLRAFFLSNDHWASILDKLSRFDKSTAGLSSFLNKKFDRELMRKSINNEQQSRRAVLTEFQNKYEEIFGKKGKKKAAKDNTIPQPFSYVDVDGEKVDVELSQNEIYKRWMELQDETLLPTFEAMGMGQDYFDSIESAMSPELKSWAEWQLNEFYPNYAKSINEVYRRVFGVDMPIKENYSPISRIRNRLDDNTSDTFDRGGIIATANNGSLKARIGNRLPLKNTDGDRVLVQYVYDMEFFKAHAESLKELRMSLLNEDVSNTINQLHGKEYMDAIRTHIDSFFNKPKDRNIAERVLNSFRTTFTVHTLALNPVVYIKQLTSIPAYANSIPIAQWIKGEALFWANPINNAKELYRNSVYLQNRYERGFDRDMVMAMQKDHKSAVTGNSNMASKMMVLTKYGDMHAILSGGWPVYDYHKKKAIREGMSQQDAINYAISKFEDSTEFAQQASDVNNLSVFQKGSEFYKVMTMYKTSPLAYHAMAMNAFRNAVGGRGNLGDNIKTFATFHIVLPIIFQWASMGFRWPDDKDDKYELIRAGILGNMNSIFIAGDLIDYIIKVGIEGKPFDYTVNNLLQGFFKNSIKSINKIDKVIDDISFNNIVEASDQLARTSSAFVPSISWYNQVSKSIDGVQDVVKGETEYPAKRALGWSDWALGENDYANKQKNKVLQKIFGKDYKQKENEENEKYFDIEDKDADKAVRKLGKKTDYR